MEQEKLISGYCRAADQSRMVMVEYEGAEILSVDCCYGSCPYETSCTIGTAISRLLKEQQS